MRVLPSRAGQLVLPNGKQELQPAEALRYLTAEAGWVWGLSRLPARMRAAAHAAAPQTTQDASECGPGGGGVS